MRTFTLVTLNLFGLYNLSTIKLLQQDYNFITLKSLNTHFHVAQQCKTQIKHLFKGSGIT